jgi:hypothetical protein
MTSVDQFFPTCEACPASQGVSKDKTTCMQCDTTNGNYDATLKNCVCNLNYFVVESDALGNLLSAKQCSACDAAAYPGPSGRVVDTCTPCAEEGQFYNKNRFPWRCECDSGNTQNQYSAAGSKCLFTNLTEPLENDSKRVDYQDVESRNKDDGSQQISSGAMN